MLDLYHKFHGLKSAYGGEVFSKHDTLSKYKFSVCFENGKNLSGFITEKIFDCFSAGTIPIYWGADNIESIFQSPTALLICENTDLIQNYFSIYQG